jgi:preprotein translocase subunit SecG
MHRHDRLFALIVIVVVLVAAVLVAAVLLRSGSDTTSGARTNVGAGDVPRFRGLVSG